MPQRLQRRQRQPLPRSAVYVGPGSLWANPYDHRHRPPHWPAGRSWGRAEAAECYELMLASGWRLKRRPGYQLVERCMAELEGRDLACWCPLEAPCHADVLLRYANPDVVGTGGVL